MALRPVTVCAVWYLVALGAHALAASDFLYYYPAPDASQANITGYYPPFIAFPVPNRTMSNITSYYAAPCGIGGPIPGPSVAAPCVPSSLADLNSPIRVCGVGANKSITVTKNITIANGSGVSKEDLYLLSDITGSMTTAISTVKLRLGDIIAARRAASADVQFGVGSYGDESGTGFYGYKNLQAITKNTTNLASAINTLTAAGGGDLPEADLVALDQIAMSNSIGWRNGSRRIVALFGDAPGHEPTCVKIGNAVKSLDRMSVASALQDRDVILVAINLGGLDDPTYSRGCNSTSFTRGDQLSYITNATGGSTLVTPDQEAVIASIVRAIGELKLTIEADTSNCTGLAIKYTPDLPLIIAPGSTFSVKQTLTTSSSVCAKSAYTCVVKYTASGAAFATQNISLTC
jgi:hypothetical protein